MARFAAVAVLPSPGMALVIRTFVIGFCCFFIRIRCAKKRYFSAAIL
jgi:hypothetical protein